MSPAWWAGHVDDFAWIPLEPATGLSGRCKPLVHTGNTDSIEFRVELIELDSSRSAQPRVHEQALTGIVLSGAGALRRGKRSVEIGPHCAFYVTPMTPYALNASRAEPLRCLLVFGTEFAGGTVRARSPGPEVLHPDTINMGSAAWAVHEEAAPLFPMEPTKGLRQGYRSFFDPNRGGATQLMAGIGYLHSGVHYTLHRHTQPEIYFILRGAGRVYIGDRHVDVVAGSVLYIPAGVVHGADVPVGSSLDIYYIYGCESAGCDTTWNPVEDVYTLSRLASP